MDVSSSVDATEDRLQRNGLAAALLATEVQTAFFASPEPVALHVFEWSGRNYQTDIVDWTLIRAPNDLTAVAERITTSTRSTDAQPTAMGYALGYAAIKLRDAPPCLSQTVDIAGDGVNNEGFSAELAYDAFAYDGVTVNGLVIASAAEGVLSYYTDQVIRGPAAFVEVAAGFADFENAMRRKLVRELASQIIGQYPPATASEG